MKKLFLFRNVQVGSAKVSHGMAVGLPSLTGITGLASAFAADLARSMGLPPTALVNAGALLAFENYKLHEGYKKITEKDKSGAKLSTRALASAFASFTAHLLLEVEGVCEAADEALANMDLVERSRDVLRTLRLCGASLVDAPRPTSLNAQKIEDLGSERLAALAMLPARARVMVSATEVVEFMRERKLPLMEGLVAATLAPALRPAAFKTFFEDVMTEYGSEHQHTYGVVQDGYLLVGSADRFAHRADFHGRHLPVHVASATLTLVRLQMAASLRISPAFEDGVHPADLAFWRLQPYRGGYLCRPSL